MRFDTYIPSNILKPYIHFIAVSEVEEDKVYKVLPGTGLVIGFQFKGNLTLLHNKEQIDLSISGITGLHDTFRIFKNTGHTGTVLIYFKDGGASAFFQQPAHELFRESVSLDNFVSRSELSSIEEQLCDAETDSQRIQTIERFLISRMSFNKNDTLILAAISLIHASKGNIKIAQLMKHLHISQSPLEKRFRQLVGTSPKKFSSIVRFKNTVNSYDPQASLTDLSYEAGYYDQAHFIKEFKKFTGDTPHSFFSNK